MKLKFRIIKLVFSQWLCVTSKYHFPTLLPVVLHLVTHCVVGFTKAGGRWVSDSPVFSTEYTVVGCAVTHAAPLNMESSS